MAKFKSGTQAHFEYGRPRAIVPKSIEIANLNEQREKTQALMTAEDKQPRKGSNTRFTDEQVREIRKDIAAVGVADTARKWNVQYNTIMYIDQGINYSRVK